MFGSKKSSSENNLLPKDLLKGLTKASDPIERVLMNEDKRRWDSGRSSVNGGGYGGGYGGDEWSGSVSPSITMSASPSDVAI